MNIAYIYDKTGTLLAQVFGILDIEINQKLNGVDTASFTISHQSEYSKREFLKEFGRVRLVQVLDGQEKEFFYGFIRGLSANLQTVTVRLRSFEGLLKRRIIKTAKNYSSQTGKYIFEDIMNTIDTESPLNLNFVSNATGSVSKDYDAGESAYSIIEDLSQSGFEFNSIGDTIYFEDQIGTDRTSGPEFLEYRYDINSPEERTINSVDMDSDSDNLANSVSTTDGINLITSNDATSIAEFSLIEDFESLSGDYTNATNEIVQRKKDTIKEFSVSVTTQDFFEASLGDTVKVYIFVGNDILFFDGPMRIVEKSYSGGDLGRISYKLSSSNFSSGNFLDEITNINQRLKTLELQ